MKCKTCGYVLVGQGSAVHCPACYPSAIFYHGTVPLPCPQCASLRAEIANKEMIRAGTEDALNDACDNVVWYKAELARKDAEIKALKQELSASILPRPARVVRGEGKV